MEIFLLAASPRVGGNSDYAAHFFAELAGGKVLFLREQKVSPCIACDYCRQYPGACSIQDDAPNLLQSMRKGNLTVIFSPIYMYHVPAGLKALLDRGQMWYYAEPAEKARPNSRLAVVFLGGRPRGEKLFEGAARTMRVFGQVTGLKVEEPLCLYGVDTKNDLARNKNAQKSLHAYALHLTKQSPGGNL